jgi:tetratricopeptide (TPR) repeat protein
MSRAVWALTLLLICLGGASTALAQDSMEDLLQRSERTAPQRAAEARALRPPETTPPQLDVQWGLRRGADNEEALARLVDQFVTSARQLGLPNRPEEASVLLLEAHELERRGQGAAAQARIDQARRVAPDMPAVDFAQADLLWRQSPQAVVDIGASLVEGYRRSWGFLPARAQVLTQVMVALLVGLLLFGLALVSVVTLRHLRLVASDLERLLPIGVTRGQLIIVGLFVIAAPGILSGSPLVSALVALVLVGAYLSWSERLGALLLCGVVALLPSLAQLGSAGVNYTGSQAAQLADWGARGCLEECQEALAQPVPEGTDPHFVHARSFLDATWRLRRGARPQWTEAGQSYQALLQQPGLSAPMRQATLNNLGVSLAAQDQHEPSIKHLREAARLAPGDWRVQLNLSRALDLSGDEAGGRAALQRAIALGGDAAAERSESERVLADFFHVASLPTGGLFEAHLRGATRRQKDSVGAARACPSCGQPMHPDAEGPSGEVRGVCRTCHQCFHERVASLDYHTRVKHEVTVDAFQTRGRWTLRVLNALLPGVGSSLNGGGAGLWLFLAASLGVALLLTHQWPLRDPWRLTPLWLDGVVLLGVALWLVAFLASAWLVLAAQSPKEES